MLIRGRILYIVHCTRILYILLYIANLLKKILDKSTLVADSIAGTPLDTGFLRTKIEI